MNGKPQVTVLLKLYNADGAPGGIFPYGSAQRMSTGFPEKGNAIFEVRSVDWRQA
jgi:hypothetical protein